jgi:trans-2,3-dihydro-3-hydroxyanthranilate isomerase
MPSYPFRQVDAFTDRPLGGNPCAVVLDADGLRDEEMLAVAREMNLSETAFVTDSRDADFGVRYFTPAREIPLAGHPTIATAYALFDAGRLRLEGSHTVVTFGLRVGPVRVELEAADGALRLVTMTQMRPEFLRRYSPREVLPVFGLSEDDLLPDAAIQTVSTGTPQLMVPLRGLEALRRASMNVEAYNALLASADFFSPHLFCLQAVAEGGLTFARHLDAPPDLPEDPFTGSATGGMAAYLWRYGLIERPSFLADQGHWMNRPGRARVEVVGTPDDIETVKVGGSAAVVVRGELFI